MSTGSMRSTSFAGDFPLRAFEIFKDLTGVERLLLEDDRRDMRVVVISNLAKRSAHSKLSFFGVCVDSLEFKSMGGNALTVLHGKRLPLVAYIELQNRVASVLSPLYKQFQPLPYMPDKKDFGDVDFMCFGAVGHSQDAKNALVHGLPGTEFLMAHPLLKSKQVLVTTPGQNMSFEVDGFQIDVNHYENHDEYMMDLFLKSFGGVGHMLGFAIKAAGLKWNREGLYILGSSSLLPPGHGPLHLVSDLDTCMSFVGLNRDTWNASEFQTDKDVYTFLSKSNLFTYKIVQDRLAHFMEKIDQLDVRPVIKDFYRFLTASKASPKFLDMDMVLYHRAAVIQFGKEAHVDAALKDYDRTKRFKELYGGTLVVNLTGLQGPRLGAFLSRLRKLCPDEISFRDFILSLDNVADFITEEFKTFTREQ